MDDVLQYFFKSNKSSVYNIVCIVLSIACDSPEQQLWAELLRHVVFLLMNTSKFEMKMIVPIYLLPVITRPCVCQYCPWNSAPICWVRGILFHFDLYFHGHWTLNTPFPCNFKDGLHFPSLISFFICIVSLSVNCLNMAYSVLIYR